MPSMAFHRLCWLGLDMAWTSLWPWIGRPYCSPVTDSSASVALWRKRTASSRFQTEPPHWTVHSSRWSPSPSSPNALTSYGQVRKRSEDKEKRRGWAILLLQESFGSILQSFYFPNINLSICLIFNILPCFCPLHFFCCWTGTSSWLSFLYNSHL